MTEVTEGHSLGLGVCVDYVLSIYASPPSVLTKPIAGGHTVVKRETGFLFRELSWAVPKRRKTEKRQEGKKNLKGSKVNQAKKCFARLLYQTWHLQIDFLKPSKLSDGIRKNSTWNLEEFIIFLERVFKHH